MQRCTSHQRQQKIQELLATPIMSFRLRAYIREPFDWIRTNTSYSLALFFLWFAPIHYSLFEFVKLYSHWRTFQLITHTHDLIHHVLDLEQSKNSTFMERHCMLALYSLLFYKLNGSECKKHQMNSGRVEKLDFSHHHIEFTIRTIQA